MKDFMHTCLETLGCIAAAVFAVICLIVGAWAAYEVGLPM